MSDVSNIYVQGIPTEVLPLILRSSFATTALNETKNSRKYLGIECCWSLILKIINTIQKFWAYRNLIIYATQKKTSFFHQICIFVHFQLVIDTCLFQQHLHLKNIERFSSFVFGIITVRWNCVSKYKNIVIK